MDVQVFGDTEELATGAADLIADALAASEGRCDIGLAGGSTPRPTYAELRARDVDWSSVDIWLSDERWVPQDSDESNGRHAAKSLVDYLPNATFHRPRFSEHLEPVDSAVFYEAQLRSVIRERPHVVLLGMGTDGHTASLFPGTAAADDTSDRWFIANHVPQLDTWRLTVTPHLLEIAEHVVVIVSGASKAEVLAEAIERPTGRHPIEVIHRNSGTVTVLADRSAAGSLSN